MLTVRCEAGKDLVSSSDTEGSTEKLPKVQKTLYQQWLSVQLGHARRTQCFAAAFFAALYGTETTETIFPNS